jgi:hypothetical protein
MSTLLVACGGASPAEAPASPDGEEMAAADDDGGEGSSADAAGEDAGGSSEGDGGDDAGPIPSKCAKMDGDVCLPPSKFTKKLCMGDYPNVAMYMFQSGTPWTRGYLSHETKAVNASGAGSTGEKMPRDEELIVLRKFEGQSPGGIQVSGANGGYEALRWDGTCVTLGEGELYFGDPPPKVGNARIIWSRIEFAIRDELKKNDTIRDVYIDYKNACKGVTVGKVSAKCEKLDGVLSRTIAEQLRVTGGFPVPKDLPE